MISISQSELRVERVAREANLRSMTYCKVDKYAKGSAISAEQCASLEYREY